MSVRDVLLLALVIMLGLAFFVAYFVFIYRATRRSR